MTTATSEAKLFGSWCALTCLGGSEHGGCVCAGPATCELQADPRFEKWREAARGRLYRYIVNLNPSFKELIEDTEFMDRAEECVRTAADFAILLPQRDGG